MLHSIVPFYSSLDDHSKLLLQSQHHTYTLTKGSYLKDSDTLCVGLFFVIKGQLRAFIRNDDGKEITLFRLLEQDGCILGASCSLKDISFDIHFYAEEETKILIVPSALYKSLQENVPAVKDFSLSMMATRFSEVMWIIEQFAFHSIDKRLANALLTFSTLQDSDEINVTHEELAMQIGSAREVVSRTLKYFEQEGYVQLLRKKVHIINRKQLMNLSDR